MFNGEGKLYDDNKVLVIYDGTFVDGLYQGMGKLTDSETEALLYDGEFYKGQYSGNGKLYQPSNGGLIYEGGFLNEPGSCGTTWEIFCMREILSGDSISGTGLVTTLTPGWFWKPANLSMAY